MILILCRPSICAGYDCSSVMSCFDTVIVSKLAAAFSSCCSCCLHPVSAATAINTKQTFFFITSAKVRPLRAKQKKKVSETGKIGGEVSVLLHSLPFKLTSSNSSSLGIAQACLALPIGSILRFIENMYHQCECYSSGCWPSWAFHAHSVIFMSEKTAVKDDSSGEQA